MAKKRRRMPGARIQAGPGPGPGLGLGGLTPLLGAVGEKRNYNLQPEVTEYQLWPFSTIEWMGAQNKFRARVTHSTQRDQ
jgi:hypothetical protein